MSRNVTLAIITILLYFSIAVTALYYLIFYYRLQRSEETRGRYDLPKAYFFCALLCGAMLDIPLYVGCAALGGPNDCEWKGSSYIIIWCFHLVATCAYVHSIITPAILWHDILHHKDGMLWNSKFGIDGTKLFFRVAFLLYCCVVLMTIIAVGVYASSSNDGFSSSNTVYAFGACLEPAVLFLIIGGCLWCGISLQNYIVKVKLGSSVQRRILLHLNITTFIILICYISRALLVLRLFNAMPVAYKNAFSCSYTVWLIGTRWMPYVFCSYCLMYGMRFNAKHSQQNKQLLLQQQQDRIAQQQQIFDEEALGFDRGIGGKYSANHSTDSSLEVSNVSDVKNKQAIHNPMNTSSTCRTRENYRYESSDSNLDATLFNKLDQAVNINEEKDRISSTDSELADKGSDMGFEQRLHSRSTGTSDTFLNIDAFSRETRTSSLITISTIDTERNFPSSAKEYPLRVNSSSNALSPRANDGTSGPSKQRSGSNSNRQSLQFISPGESTSSRIKQ